MRSFKNVYKSIPQSEQEWRTHRQDKKRLIIEIGAGAGFNAIKHAKAYPNDFIVVIERTLNKSKKMLGRIKNHPELTNIFPVCGDAIPWICENCLPEEVDEYIILYPNPYPKTKHANKRFFNMPFMEKIIETLKPQGTILLATNIFSYYQEAKDAANNIWSLIIKDDCVLSADFVPRSHFEKKYLARGEVCFQLILQKSIAHVP